MRKRRGSSGSGSRYKVCGVTMVGVNVQDHEAAAQRFIRQFGQTFPNGMDRTGRISIDFGVYGVPETFVVDQHGLVRAKYVGAVPEEGLIGHIHRLFDIEVSALTRSCSSRDARKRSQSYRPEVLRDAIRMGVARRYCARRPAHYRMGPIGASVRRGHGRADGAHDGADDAVSEYGGHDGANDA